MEWQAIFGVGSAQILGRLNLTPGMRVLDVGCGSGRLSIPAARRVGAQGRVVALDLRSDELRTLEEQARSHGLTNIRTVHRSIEVAALDANVFDRAVLVAVLGEIRDRVTALRHLFAALAPGGWLSITETILDPHYQRRATVLSLAETLGFQFGQFHRTWAAYTLNFSKPSVT